MADYCGSCSMPIDAPEARGASADYCKYCTDATGKLKPRAEVRAAIAMWLRGWQDGITEEQARVRAVHFMLAMPAWASD